MGSAAILLILSATADSTRAETLPWAIAAAYQNDPQILSQRAQLRIVDEDYVQAEAALRPTLSAQVTSGYSRQPQSSLFGGSSEIPSNSGGFQLNFQQPIYTGGRATAGIRAADASVRAGREQLRASEATVIFNAIQAYCDVRRDREALVLQRASLKVLQDAVDEIGARYQAGANTITDVSQAQAQIEIAHTLVTTAQAQQELSEAEYVTAIGHHPADLEAPPPLPGLPATLDDAFDIADQESPQVRQARFVEAQGRALVQQARAAARPTIALSSSFGYAGTVSPFMARDYRQNISGTVQFSQPIFTGGVNSSKLRQALAQNGADRMQVHEAERSEIQAASRAWIQRQAARLNVATERAEVRSAQATFDGMRVEYRAGLRATLDVLIAQQTLRDAQVGLVQAEHDDYLAQAAILGAVGRLEISALIRGVEIYQPQLALRAVENAGSLPWDAITRTIDRIGAPGPSELALSQGSGPAVGSIEMVEPARRADRLAIPPSPQ